MRRGQRFSAILNDAAMEIFAGGAPTDHDPETPLEAYVPAHLASEISVEDRAAVAGLCRFYQFGCPQPRPAPVAGVRRKSQGSEARKTFEQALAFHAARTALAKATCVTLALSGRRFGFEAHLPPVADEVLCSMETAGSSMADPDSMRVLLIGEYGGIGRAMVRYLLGRTELSPALTLAGQASATPSVAALMELPEAKDWVVERYAALEEAMSALRTVAHLPGHTLLPRLGITVESWRALMQTSSIGFARRIIEGSVIPTLMTRRVRAA